MPASSGAPCHSTYHSTYHSPARLEAAVAASAARARDRAQLTVFGRSVEGRELVAVTVAAPGRRPEPSRPHAVVLANIHGNEVVSSELALALLGALCDDDLGDGPAAALDVADVTVVPALNVDGRGRSFASLERRGLFHNAPRRNARGVDLNRNWPWPRGARDHWLPLAGVRTRLLPWCRGPYPLSEPETKALAAFVAARPPFVLLNLHSTGQILTYPWSCRAAPPADRDGFLAMTAAFRAAQTRWRYRYKQSRAWYPIVGSSNDYFYERHGTLAMTVEIAREGAAARDDWRRARWVFWFANPADPAPHIDNDLPACLAAIAAAARYKGLAQ
jgi:predicted deacylase